MRKFSILVAFLLCFNNFHLSAAFEDSISTEEQILPEDTQGKPFSLLTSYDYIGYSKMEKEGFKCTNIKYNQLSILGSAVFYSNPCYREGALIQSGYTREQIYWFENPFFNQTNFNTADLTLLVFSERLCDWLWTASVGMGYDTDRNSFTNATSWDILMWGRYSCRPNLGLHIGFLGQTGMRIDRVYPIIGFDWVPQNWSRWKINVVYPVNIAVLYTIDCNWSAGVAGRFFNSRHRLSENAAVPNGLITYSNTGAEFRLNYDYCSWISANAHVGATFGGQLKVANYKYRDKQHFDFGSAGYVGGEIAVNF